MYRRFQFRSNTISITYRIVSGLNDKSLINAVTGYIPQCKSLQDLLCQIKAHLCIIEQQRNREIFLNRQSYNSTRSAQKSFIGHELQYAKTNLTCYNCQEAGHFARNCPKQRKRHGKSTYNYSSPKVSRVSFNRSCGLMQNALVDGQVVNAFCDLGSECSTIKRKTAEKFGWSFEECNTKLIGFGGKEVYAMGRLIKPIKIQSVGFQIELLVVNDGDQEYDMIVGQNFLDHEGVKIIRENGVLTILPSHGESD